MPAIMNSLQDAFNALDDVHFYLEQQTADHDADCACRLCDLVGRIGDCRDDLPSDDEDEE